MNEIKNTAATQAEKLKAKALAEAERVKAIAATEAIEKNKKDEAEAEKLKEAAALEAAKVKDDASMDAESLITLAESVAKKQLKLLLQNSMFQAIFNTIHDGAIVADTTGKILFYNKAAADIIGHDSITDQPPASFAKYFNLYKPDKITPWPPGEDPLARTMKGNTTIGEMMFVKNENTPTLISCMAVPFTYGNKPVVVGGFMMFRRTQYLTDNL